MLLYPSGSAWRKLIAEGSRKRRRANFSDKTVEDADDEAVENAEWWLERELQSQKQTVRCGGKYVFNVQVAAEKFEFIRAAAVKRKKKRTKAAATSKEQAPNNTREALDCEHAEEWVESLGNEFYGLVYNRGCA